MKLLQLMLKAGKSNTIQFNGIFLGILAALMDTEFIKTNPEYTAIIMGVQAIANILLRLKTKKPIAER